MVVLAYCEALYKSCVEGCILLQPHKYTDLSESVLHSCAKRCSEETRVRVNSQGLSWLDEPSRKRRKQTIGPSIDGPQRARPLGGAQHVVALHPDASALASLSGADPAALKSVEAAKNVLSRLWAVITAPGRDGAVLPRCTGKHAARTERAGFRRLTQHRANAGGVDHVRPGCDEPSRHLQAFVFVRRRDWPESKTATSDVVSRCRSVPVSA